MTNPAPTPASLQVLMVDDEPLARHWLRMQLSKCTTPIELSEAASAALAMAWLAHHQCHVVFLDIHMPGTNGLDFAQYCQTLTPSPAIIFVTADSTHALQAFELAAFDYLTKPVSVERLEQALQKVSERAHFFSPVSPPPVPDGPTVLIDSAQHISQIPLNDVLYFQAESKYTKVVTADKNYFIESSLNALEEQLKEHVIRVHRSYLVPKHAIIQLVRNTDDVADSWMVKIHGMEEPIAVSRRMLPQVKELLRTA